MLYCYLQGVSIPYLQDWPLTLNVSWEKEAKEATIYRFVWMAKFGAAYCLRTDILTAVDIEVGLSHPPMGLNLYVASGIAKMGITELTIAVWSWLLTMLVFLAW